MHILVAAAPGLLSLKGRPNWILRYISVGPDPASSSGFEIDFAGMRKDLDFSGPVGEMVRVAWEMFNGGDPEQGSPRFDDVVYRLDLKNFQAVIEAMQLRKGTYPAPFLQPPRAEVEREAYRRQRFTDGMIDEIAEDADRQASHNAAVEQIRERVLGRLAAFVLELETQTNTEAR